MNHLDLFSGIGGFALAAQRTWGEDHKIVGFCEIDKKCQLVLKKHWPDVTMYEDIQELDGNQIETVDLVTGGFPCQPYSVAGKQKGAEDDRALWPEMLRIIQETRPAWIIAENVTGIIDLALDEVLASLEGSGYETETYIIPACAIDAPHRRDRVWIIAHSNCKSESNGAINDGKKRILSNSDQFNDDLSRHGTGKISQFEATEVFENSLADSQKQRLERPVTARNSCTDGLPAKFCKDVSNTNSRQRKNRMQTWEQKNRAQNKTGMDNRIARQSNFGKSDWWSIEPGVGRVVNGLSGRVDRLKQLGNAIVPQVARVLMEHIKIVESEFINE